LLNREKSSNRARNSDYSAQEAHIADPEFLLKNSTVERLRRQVESAEEENVLAALDEMAAYLTSHRPNATEHEPTFDIFRGFPRTTDVLWVESVKGLAAARERMDFLAAAKPGPYFVFSSSDHSYLAIVDSTIRVQKTGAA